MSSLPTVSFTFGTTFPTILVCAHHCSLNSAVAHHVLCAHTPCLFSVCYGVVGIRHTTLKSCLFFCLGLIICTLSPVWIVVSTDYPNKLLLLELTCFCVCVHHDNVIMAFTCFMHIIWIS